MLKLNKNLRKDLKCWKFLAGDENMKTNQKRNYVLDI